MGIQRRRRRTRGAQDGAPLGEPANANTDEPGGATGTEPDSMRTRDQIGAADVAAEPPEPEAHRPSPHDLAERGGSFALTAAVHDPDERQEAGEGPAAEPDPVEAAPPEPAQRHRPDQHRPDQHRPDQHRPDYRLDPEDTHTERGLRGLVGSGSSQVSVTAAMRARDAARPSDAELAAAEAELVIVRRGWVPREELPRTGRR